MKKILLLPGSAMQVPLIKRLKNKGYYVVSFHPTDEFPTKPFSDEYVLVDILDRKNCLKEVQRILPDVILSEECDIAIPTIAFLSDKLGLHSLSIDDASLYTDKSKMREFCNKHSIPSPAYRKCTRIDEAKDFYRIQNRRCILKPLDSNCSKGIYIVNSENDIDKYWNDSICYSKCSNEVIIEQYIDGIEFTVDGIVTPSGHKSLAISEKKHYDYNPNIAYELFFSNYSDNFDYDALRKVNDSFVNYSSLPVGFFTHAEYKFMDGIFYLIEIGARGGGNYISSDIVPLMSGVDNYGYFIDAVVEGNMEQSIDIDNTLQDRCAVLYFLDVPREGVVKKVHGLDILSNNPNVIRYELHFKEGDTIQRAKNDSARVGYYIAYADTKEDLRMLMKKINEEFKIIIG